MRLQGYYQRNFKPLMHYRGLPVYTLSPTSFIWGRAVVVLPRNL